MPMRLTALAIACLALAGAAAVPAGSATWHSFHLSARAYGGYGKCSHAASEPSGGCQGVVESGSFEGRALSGGVRWVWNHTSGTLEVIGTGFELRGHVAMSWSSFKVASGAFGDGRLYRSGSQIAEAGKPGGVLHLVLTNHTAFDGKSGKKVPGYALAVTGFLETY